jgi:hypothetical protein
MTGAGPRRMPREGHRLRKARNLTVLQLRRWLCSIGHSGDSETRVPWTVSAVTAMVGCAVDRNDLIPVASLSVLDKTPALK